MQATESNPAPERALIPIPDARAYLGGVGLTMLYRLVNDGHLRKVKINRRSFITTKSLEAYVNSLQSA